MDEEELESFEFNNLPKDIIFDIFSRIPLKHLYQLRCVCKKWLFYLHQNPEFRDFYHQKHKINPILLFTKQIMENPSTQLSSYYIDGTPITQISTNFDQSLISTLTCNGILCLITKTNAFLYDPITMRISNLPNSNPRRFDSSFGWAFGFSPFRNVFKILHFYTIEKKFDNFHYCQTQEIMCEILNKPNSDLGFESQEEWNNLGICPFDFLGRKNYAFVDGKFYWLIGEKKFNPENIKIMSFDLEFEGFGLNYFPKSCSNRSVECLDLVEIRDFLCLTDRLPWESSMDIWMMEKENKGFPNFWVRKYKVDLMGINHHDVRILGHVIKINGGDCESEGKIMIKFGGQSFGFYELDNEVFTNLAGEINFQGWDLQLMVNRKFLL
ncbi:putative F-box/kelch-repeat protein At3g17280 [Chenopodium quinoa]|uniref:putative F-box/kelch-repeat protein At3g17280 n=1 Tax=Chenopodium quinoa TaxID=63459 RepID=UPI000B77E198|nr:putative F-box/kelch-repeat protein At3g17280 [Chenopodium quinoa]